MLLSWAEHFWLTGGWRARTVNAVARHRTNNMHSTIPSTLERSYRIHTRRIKTTAKQSVSQPIWWVRTRELAVHSRKTDLDRFQYAQN